MNRLTRLSVISLICLLQTACTTLLPQKPEAPTVSVTRVIPRNLSLSSTELDITLRVANPNGFDLPIQSLDFAVFFSGEKIADGKNSDAVTLPAKGEALVDVSVVAGLSRLWDQLKSVLSDKNSALNYNVAGTIKLANWPARIPFNVERELKQPKLK